MFVIITDPKYITGNPTIQFVPEEDFDDPLMRPFEYLQFEVCDVIS